MPKTPPISPLNSRDTGGPSAVVEADGLCKSFSRGAARTLVLDRVDLRIGSGECVFLVGPSGSGKSTLMSMIGCVLSPDAGVLRVLGEDLTRLDEDAKAALRRRRIGFVFQRFHLIRGLNAIENVEVPLRLDGWGVAAARRRAAELLDRVGLAEKSSEAPARLSVGQCQRVAVARALVADPDLVLADEPTASLDAQSGQQAMRLLREMTVEAGKTLVVVTHDHRILDFAGRTLLMEGGRLAASLPAPPHAATAADSPVPIIAGLTPPGTAAFGVPAFN